MAHTDKSSWHGLTTCCNSISQKLNNVAPVLRCAKSSTVSSSMYRCQKSSSMSTPNMHIYKISKFFKRYWDQYFPGGEYDAVARRRAAGGPGAAPSAAPRVSAGSGAARRGVTPTTSGARVAKVGAVGGGGGGGAASAALKAENDTLKETVAGLERERDFYFSKLRDIELLVQQACEEDPEIEKQEDGLIKHIQTILYSTEDGFEIPAEAEVDDQEETF
ncbi:hypothetical protein BPOR_0168g00050 [Botrytis porri]|uniref:EB1 C-terminal domain-containing protein n=1 Tax=Botrytis porri TaxID=87229 RepID=A0A4Z1KV15_9HELO|nr:hypothetical protein BPOR_0168g00050 [Botrytis porri]